MRFSGVLGFTYNFKKHCDAVVSVNGVDLHFDWGASQFLSKQVMVGLVGLCLQGHRLRTAAQATMSACFQSQVVGIGPPDRVPFFRSATCRAISILRLTESSLLQTGHQAWNTWVTFSISPLAPGAPPTTKPIVRKY